MLIVGSNPRREAPVLNARIRKRWRHGEPQDRRDRRARRPDLRLRPISAPAPRRSPVARRRLRKPADAKRPIWLVGQGALTRPDGVAVLAAVAKAAVATGALRRRLERLLRAAHRGRARRRPRPRLRAGRRRPRRRGDGARAALDLLFLLGADEIEVEPGRLRRLSSAPMATAAPTAPTSSCRAPPTPRRPRLYVNTEGRVQRGRPRRLPAGRGARGLGDPARALRRARPAAALRLAAAAAGRAVPRPPASCHPRRHRAGQRRRRAGARRKSAAASTRRRSSRRSRTSISPTRSRGRRAVMAECSALAEAAADGGGVGHDGGVLHRLRLAADRHGRARACCCSSSC